MNYLALQKSCLAVLDTLLETRTQPKILILLMLTQNETPLLQPDILVCSVGTEILHNTENGYIADADWAAMLSKDWNASVSAEIGTEFGDALELQVSIMQTMQFH